LIVETTSNRNKFGETWNHSFKWALAGFKRKARLERLLIASYFVPRNYLSYVGKDLPVKDGIVTQLISNGGQEGIKAFKE